MPQVSPKKAIKNQAFSAIITMIVAALFLFAIWQTGGFDSPRLYTIAIIGLITCVLLYRSLTKKYRNRNKVLSQPFPKKWRTILNQYVVYYQTLSAQQQSQFEQNVQIFLAEKRITGIKTTIDDTVRVLVAASAIIPIFGFKEWEYDNLGEVLIYPDRFSTNYDIEGSDRNVLGMVGTGAMQGMMILSKKALLDGFQNTKDGKNTAIHEFVHLIDAKDGDFDGIPPLLANQYITPWLDMMYKEIEAIKNRDSELNPYGATNEIEFLAVASEYFFERPHAMKDNYPELYKMLTRIFHQDLTNQFTYQVRDLVGYTGKKIGRNAPCPCGSGQKYKKCCLNT